MAADNWKKFESFPEYAGDGTMDMDDDTFICALLTSVWTPNVATQSVWADISANEVTGNGYAQHSCTQTWTHSGGTTTFDSDDPQYTASGGNIVFRYACVYDDTPAATPTDPLCFYSLVDNTPADTTINDGNSLSLVINASGMYYITGMTT